MESGTPIHEYPEPSVIEYGGSGLLILLGVTAVTYPSSFVGGVAGFPVYALIVSINSLFGWTGGLGHEHVLYARIGGGILVAAGVLTLTILYLVQQETTKPRESA